MDTPRAFLTDLLRQSLRDPRAAARRVMAIDLPPASRWEALALVVILSAMVGQISILLMTGELTAPGLLGTPLQSVVIQGAVLLVMVQAIYHVGRALGGTGEFGQALLLVSWLQCVMIGVQILQILAMTIMPPLAGLIGVAGMVLFIWLLTNFIAELHGFPSLGRVFAMILATAFALAFVAAVVMGILGIQPPGDM